MKCQGERGCEEDPEGILDRSFLVSNYLGLVIVPGQQIQGPSTFALCATNQHLFWLGISIWKHFRYSTIQFDIHTIIQIYDLYIYNTYDTNKNRNNTLRIAIIIKSLRVTPLLPILQGFSHGHLPKNGLKTCPWWKVKIQSEFWMVLEWYFHDQRSFALLMLVKLLWYHVFGCKNFAEN